jgi:hypothetical protein
MAMARGNRDGLIRPHGASRGLKWKAIPAACVPRDPRKVSTERVKQIDPIFKAGNLEAFWPALRELIEMAPHRRDLSMKKSHYLTSLAARSLVQDDPKAELEFPELTDREIDHGHLTPYLLKEREDSRQQAELALHIGALLADHSKSAEP